MATAVETWVEEQARLAQPARVIGVTGLKARPFGCWKSG
jgi:hypothetical protein